MWHREGGSVLAWAFHKGGMCEDRTLGGRSPEGITRGMFGKSQEPPWRLVRHDGGCMGWKELAGVGIWNHTVISLSYFYGLLWSDST